MWTVCIWVPSFNIIAGKDNRIVICVMSRYTMLKTLKNNSVFGDHFALARDICMKFSVAMQRYIPHTLTTFSAINSHFP